MLKLIVAMSVVTFAPTLAHAQEAPTLIEQLQSYLAYELGELDEDECALTNNQCYHYWRSERLEAQLGAAQAAAASGNPLPPLRGETGSRTAGQVQAVYPPNGN